MALFRIASRTCCLAVLFLLGAQPIVGLQQPPQSPPAPNEPAFRGTSTIVPIDVRVVDRLGQPVTDLTASDFVVFENGVRQRVSHFAVQALTPHVTDGAALPLRPVTKVTDLSPEPRRAFLIVLGRGRLQPPSKGVDGLIHFVRDRLLPQDLVAVLAWDRATEFTADHAAIAELLERFKTIHERIEGKLKNRLAGLAAIYGGIEMPVELRTDIDKVFNGPRAPLTRTPVPPSIASSDRIESDTRRTTDVFLQTGLSSASITAAETGRITASGMTLDDFVSINAQSMQDVGNLYTGVRYLQYLDGEKHLIFASERTPMLPRAEDDKDLAAFASDARVAIHYIHTGGTAGALSPSGSAAGARVQSGMDASRPIAGAFVARTPPIMLAPTGRGGTFELARTLANQTGGQFYGNRNGKAAIDLDYIDTATRYSYLLGYTPVARLQDGRYRRIDVRVNRPGVTVFFRHGYYARNEPTPLNRQRMITYSRVVSAANYPKGVPDIPVQASATTSAGETVPRTVTVAITIDPSRLHFSKTPDGRNAASIEVAVFGVRDHGQNLVGQWWRTLEVTFTDERLQQIKREGFHHSVDLSTVPPAEEVRVVVYDAGADLVGSAIVKPRKE